MCQSRVGAGQVGEVGRGGTAWAAEGRRGAPEDLVYPETVHELDPEGSAGVTGGFSRGQICVLERSYGLGLCQSGLLLFSQHPAYLYFNLVTVHRKSN